MLIRQSFGGDPELIGQWQRHNAGASMSGGISGLQIEFADLAVPDLVEYLRDVVIPRLTPLEGESWDLPND